MLTVSDSAGAHRARLQVIRETDEGPRMRLNRAMTQKGLGIHGITQAEQR